MTSAQQAVNPSHLHIRVVDEEGDIASHGGASIAYHLILGDDKKVLALCGLSVCSDLDNFNKKLGNKIATSRLNRLLQLTNHQGGYSSQLTMVVEIAAEAFLAEAKVELKVLQETEHLTFVLLKEDDFPIAEMLIASAIETIRTHRVDTYEGDDPDVLEAIDEMFQVDEESDEDPDEETDETEESDDEEEPSSIRV